MKYVLRFYRLLTMRGSRGSCNNLEMQTDCKTGAAQEMVVLLFVATGKKQNITQQKILSFGYSSVL